MGPVCNSGDEAVAAWNRRTARQLADSCLIGNFDEIDGKWNGEGDLRTTWWNRGVADGLRTALRLAKENGCEGTVTEIQKSIAHHSAVLARSLAATGETLVIASAPIDVQELRPGMIRLDTPDAIEAARVLFPPGEANRALDELAAARERRDLAALPSVDTTAAPDGLAMDFDLGGPPKKR